MKVGKDERHDEISAQMTAKPCRGNPAPHVIPTPVTRRTSGGGVSPFTRSPRTKISPPPMNLMLVTSLRRDRKGSRYHIVFGEHVREAVLGDRQEQSSAVVPTSV
jgi:hypothetical protein